MRASTVTPLLIGAVFGMFATAIVVVLEEPAAPAPHAPPPAKASAAKAATGAASARGHGSEKTDKPFTVDGERNPFIALRPDERTLDRQTRTTVGRQHAFDKQPGHVALMVGVGIADGHRDDVRVELVRGGTGDADGTGDGEVLQTGTASPAADRGRFVDVRFDLSRLPDGPYTLRLAADDADDALVLSRPALLRAPPSTGARNLILISIDTLRADYLGTYGYDAYPTSRHLDARAKRGTVFERAISPSPWTVPGHTAMLTGTDPDKHGLDRQVGHTPRLPDEVTTLAELFADAGYLPVAFTGRGTMAARNGFSDGFYLYQESSSRLRTLMRDMDGNRHAATSWMRAHAQQPFFLFFHTFEAHAPYGHARFVSDTRDIVLQAKQAYASGIAFVDDQLERMLVDLEAMGLLENTMVVVVSDHGEGFLEHPPHKEHGETLFDEFIHVPLILWGPGIPAGKRVAPPVGLVNLTPTLADYFGLALPEGLPSRSLRPLIEGMPPADGDGDVFLCCMAHGAQKRGVRTPTWKYFEDVAPTTPRSPDAEPTQGSRWLFDLGTDPAERANLVQAPTPDATEVLRRLSARTRQRAAHNGSDAPRPAPELVDPKMAEQLRALGYIE